MRRVAALLLLAAAVAAGPKENTPPDCVVVNHFDFAALRQAEVWPRIAKPVVEFLKEGMGLEGLFEGIGFDPETDLSSLTFALGGDMAKGDEQVYVIARGKFDAKKFAECLAEAGIKPVERGGMTVFEDPDAKGRITCAFRGAFGLLDGVLLFADPAKGLDELRAAQKGDAPRSDISKLLAAAPEAHAWTVLSPTPAFRDALREDPQGVPFAALKSGVITYTLGPQVEIACNAEAESADLAKQVLFVAQAGLTGLGLKELPKLECVGATLKGSLTIPLDEAMTMAGMPVESEERPGTSALPVLTGDAPKLVGKGDLQRLALPGQVNGMVVSPDGTTVFVDRAQESDVVLDADLHVVGKTPDTWGRMGFTLDGKAGLWPYRPGGSAEIRSIPDLSVLHEVERAPGHYDEPWAVCALPDGKSFAVVDWKSVRLFHTDPPRWGEEGKPHFDRAIAGAVDAKTGLLVMISNDTWLEVFDPATLKSLGTLSLPREVTYDVAATGGRAWVGTKDGQILPIDIEGRRVLDPVRVWDGGDVALTMSGSGRTLIAAARKFVDGDHHPARVLAFEIASGELREVASAEFLSPCAFNDVAVLEGAHTVLFGGRESFVWRYGD